jgi:hypothetical protein
MGPLVFGAGNFFRAPTTDARAGTAGCWDPGRASTGAETEPVGCAALCITSILADNADIWSDRLFSSAFWADIS